MARRFFFSRLASSHSCYSCNGLIDLMRLVGTVKESVQTTSEKIVPPLHAKEMLFASWRIFNIFCARSSLPSAKRNFLALLSQRNKVATRSPSLRTRESGIYHLNLKISMSKQTTIMSELANDASIQLCLHSCRVRALAPLVDLVDRSLRDSCSTSCLKVWETRQQTA